MGFSAAGGKSSSSRKSRNGGKDGGSGIVPKGKGGRRVLTAVMVAKAAERKKVTEALSEAAIVKKGLLPCGIGHKCPQGSDKV